MPISFGLCSVSERSTAISSQREERKMIVDLGVGVAGVSIAISVIDDYMQELYRIVRIPHSTPLRNAA